MEDYFKLIQDKLLASQVEEIGRLRGANDLLKKEIEELREENVKLRQREEEYRLQLIDLNDPFKIYCNDCKKETNHQKQPKPSIYKNERHTRIACMGCGHITTMIEKLLDLENWDKPEYSPPLELELVFPDKDVIEVMKIELENDYRKIFDVEADKQYSIDKIKRFFKKVYKAIKEYQHGEDDDSFDQKIINLFELGLLSKTQKDFILEINNQDSINFENINEKDYFTLVKVFDSIIRSILLIESETAQSLIKKRFYEFKDSNPYPNSHRQRR